ncbi:hypothetical protein Atep_00130 [Allochromatium tepidum]|uniref:PepSY domain-containing protein n=2 Tax=Allochromatium tepidum TaxID=553982 RepID=A0ABM7QHU5_9GAMM|nr:hypothetical protein Atep_00130 [Allochromatium tepidum]
MASSSMRSVILIGLLSLIPLQAGADDGVDDGRAEWYEQPHRHDHELAREARLRGEIRPIAGILRQVGEQVPGEVIGIELERGKRAGRPVWIYEIKILSPDGRRQEVEVDAGDGRILQLEEDD